MRNILFQFGELLFDIIDKCGAAGACEEAFLCKLGGFGVSNHIGAQSGLNNMMEAELLNTRDNLAEISVCELARNARRWSRNGATYCFSPLTRRSSPK